MPDDEVSIVSTKSATGALSFRMNCRKKQFPDGIREVRLCVDANAGLIGLFKLDDGEIGRKLSHYGKGSKSVYITLCSEKEFKIWGFEKGRYKIVRKKGGQYDGMYFMIRRRKKEAEKKSKKAK
jgi:hypothetical protein